jgi:hypothetical protein
MRHLVHRKPRVFDAISAESRARSQRLRSRLGLAAASEENVRTWLFAKHETTSFTVTCLYAPASDRAGCLRHAVGS